jgi:hypothetical protein
MTKLTKPPPSPTLFFIVRCIEDYKYAKDIDGNTAIQLFFRYGVIDYLREFYEPLHINGPQYMVEEIDLFIAARQDKGGEDLPPLP